MSSMPALQQKAPLPLSAGVTVAETLDKAFVHHHTAIMGQFPFPSHLEYRKDYEEKGVR